MVKRPGRWAVRGGAVGPHPQRVARAAQCSRSWALRRAGLSAKAVARRCGLNLSTSYHLLRTLAFEGYLQRTVTGDYVLGLEIADRFRDLKAALAGPGDVTPVLRGVSSETGLTAYLARFVDGRIAITAVAEGPGSPHVEDLIPGFDEAAHATALGKALLSTLPSPQRRVYLGETGLRPFTPATTTEADALDHELAATQGGLYVEVGQYRPDVACAAVLVPTGAADDPWWSIAVSAAASAFGRSMASLTTTLRAGAGHLARPA